MRNYFLIFQTIFYHFSIFKTIFILEENLEKLETL